MRKLFFAALFCVSLAATPASGAGVDMVLSVEGWPRMSTRADGKLAVHAYSLGVPDTTGSTTGTRAKAQRLSITMDNGDAAALFARTALRGETLKTVLFEVFAAGPEKPAPRAPFAVRLTGVRVTSVQFGGSRNNDFPGTVNVNLEGSVLEMFTATQDKTGAMKAGQQFGWDYRAGKAP